MTQKRFKVFVRLYVRARQLKYPVGTNSQKVAIKNLCGFSARAPSVFTPENLSTIQMKHDSNLCVVEAIEDFFSVF